LLVIFQSELDKTIQPINLDVNSKYNQTSSSFFQQTRGAVISVREVDRTNRHLLDPPLVSWFSLSHMQTNHLRILQWCMLSLSVTLIVLLLQMINDCICKFIHSLVYIIIHANNRHWIYNKYVNHSFVQYLWKLLILSNFHYTRLSTVS